MAKMSGLWLQERAGKAPDAMWRLILGVLIFTALLAGTALLSAYALPWLMSAQHSPQTVHAPPPSNVTSVPKDMNALVRAALCPSARTPRSQPCIEAQR